MKILSLANPSNDEHSGDTFAERAESYYSKRPVLITLLQDLYNAYITLSDRYMQLSSSSTLKRHDSQGSIVTNDTNFGNNDGDVSDVESSLSYQRPGVQEVGVDRDAEDYFSAVVAELVARTVEADVLADEARRCGEWRRKAELQGSLVEVLESERVVLLRENAQAGRRCAVVAEEAEAMAAEAAFMRRKAGELARCLLLRAREEHRVCTLSRKIEDLQSQIHGLEKRNSDYSSQLRRSTEAGGSAKRRSGAGFEGCFGKMKLKKVMKKKKSEKGGSGWWGKVKSMELFPCGVA